MERKGLTDGPILRGLLLFALPMMAGNLLQQVYSIVDTLIVGRCIGSGALAAVGSAYTLTVFINSILIGLCMGSGALFSQAYGAGDGGRLRQDIRLSFLFIAAATAVIYLIVYPGMDAILRLLQIPEALAQPSRTYIGAVFVGIGFVAVYNFFAYVLRSMGESVIPLVFLGISSVLNVGLDLLFVAGLGWGIGGAAWATVLSQAVSGIGIAVYGLLRVPVLREARRAPFSGSRLLEIIRNDLATGLQQSVMNFGILMIQGLVNSFGVTVMAAFAAAVKIDTPAYMPAQEFANAYSLFVAQNCGARRPERVHRGTRLAMLSTGAFCMIVSAAICVAARPLMLAFVQPQEMEILAEGMRYLRIEGACYLGIGILFLWYGYFRGIGRPAVSLLLTVISLGTRVLLSYTLAPHTPLGVTAIWLSIPIGWALADIAGLLLYRRSGD